ncbi:MAG: hypothetical protein Q7V63_06295 [Gammaproteobacteria bacterium]|nr:hypothetical protein [Gammaproteobacteria bacterium]
MSESIKIKGKETNYNSKYKTVDFSDLRFGFNNSNNLIGYEGFTLNDYISNEIYTGNELLHYPKLAKALRVSIKEYPTMTRKYQVDKEVIGLKLFEYLDHRFKEVVSLFENEQKEASDKIENLVNHFGLAKKMPIIDKINETKNEWQNWKTGLIINGVEWLFNNETKDGELFTVVNMRDLLNISYSDFEKVELEDAVIGTPFVAFRLGKTWRHTGTVQWYNLDTMQEVKKSDIAKWKKS